MSNSYSFIAMYPLPTVFRTVALLSISITAILAVFYSPVRAEAQETCGNIVSINPYSGDTQSVPIEVCDDPFAPNQTVPENLDLTVDGVAVEIGSTQVSIPNETFQYVGPGNREGPQNWGRFTMQVYERSGDDFVQIDLRPPSIEDLTQEQGLAILEDYYADDPDLEAYREAFRTGDQSGFVEEQAISYNNFLFDIVPQILAEQYSPQVPLGTYWLVFTEEILCVSQAPKQKFWLADLLEQIIPTVHAQSGDVCAPGYVPKRFVLELDIIKALDEPTGASSVLFLPGIQASRLYESDDGSEVKLWETTSNDDIARLEMNNEGDSVNNIYTKDAIPAAFGITDIYRDFLVDLFKLKNNEIIFDYEIFAYDWRYSVFDAATKPVSYPDDDVKILLDEVLRLAEDSYTEKVTIVAHSNGGLVAKALLHEYGDTVLADKVDKLVLIGTPQLGTPKAVNSMLHGSILDGFADTVLFDNQLVRDTIRNMPGTYTLLPSTRYFSEVADEPLITNDGSISAAQVSSYGPIADRVQLTNFLLDSNETFSATPSTYEPKALNEELLSQSVSEQAILDAWKAPENVEIYEVVGTGLPTIAGIEYKEYKCTFIFGLIPCRNSVQLQPKLKFTNQGDQTVVAGSAAGYQGDKTVAFVDLELEGSQRFVKERNHSNLTESPTVQAFVDSVIKYPYLADSVLIPEFSEVSSQYTIISTHSPVKPRIVMSDGRVVGLDNDEIKEEVVGSQYLTLASSTYLILPKDAGDYQIEILGEQVGVYTLEVEELTPDDIQQVVVEIVASTTANMRSSLAVTDNGYGNLLSDFDGDGEIDEERTPQGDLVNSSQEQTIYTYDDLQNTIAKIDNRFIKRYLDRFAVKARQYHDQIDRHKRYSKLEQLFLKLLVRKTEFLIRKGRIDESTGEELSVIISYLRKS